MTMTLINLDVSTAEVSILSDENAQLRQLQELVGGPIEGVPLPDGKYMIFAENGKDSAHFINQLATDIAHASESIMADDYIAGVAVILPKEVLE
jgi:hypothetical protein